MGVSDLFSKVRQLDNLFARWLMRHFYFIFFEFVLVGVFFLYFYEAKRTLDQLTLTSSTTKVEALLGQQNINTLIIGALMILNSFWMLYMFNGIERLRVILKDISYSLMRRKSPP